MKAFNVDGKTIMLNEAEANYWVDTGNFKRIPDKDEDDKEYLQKKREMINCGDEEYYNHITAF